MDAKEFMSGSCDVPPVSVWTGMEHDSPSKFPSPSMRQILEYSLTYGVQTGYSKGTRAMAGRNSWFVRIVSASPCPSMSMQYAMCKCAGAGRNLPREGEGGTPSHPTKSGELEVPHLRPGQPGEIEFNIKYLAAPRKTLTVACMRTWVLG
jgi:hypothetical protein